MKVLNKDKFQKLPDAILIDIDNTLYPYEPAHLAAYRSVREKINKSLSLKSSEFDNIYREARKNVKLQLGETASSHSRLLYFQKMFEYMGLGSQPFLSLECEQNYWREFLKHTILFDNVINFLQDLRLADVQVAIVTNLNSQIQYRKLIYWNIENFFEFIITSEEVGVDKPSPKIFKFAIDKLSLEGKQIWMIGDDISNDMIGAKKSIGATTLYKTNETTLMMSKFDKNIDLVFNSFESLRKLLANLQN